MTVKWIIPQSDFSLLLQVDTEGFAEMRNFLSLFAHAEKTPEHIHTYKLNPVSIWNAASLGYDADMIVENLKNYSLFEVPNNIVFFIKDQFRRYGLIKIHARDMEYQLTFYDRYIQEEVEHTEEFSLYVSGKVDGKPDTYHLKTLHRGKIKAFLIELGFPVEDLWGYKDGDPLPFSLVWDWGLREYQQKAVDAFRAWGSVGWGSWVVVLACGWGKTIVWIGIIHKLQTKTLIVTTTANACFQFKKEILSKTTLTEAQVGIFVWGEKDLKDITITTYSMLTYREDRDKDFLNMQVFESVNWGLIIYDEVHMLPAPVFSYVAELQSKRRLGLTATLVREDHKEDLIFSLIWPKKYDLPWKDLETSGFIATAICREIRTGMSHELKEIYVKSSKREKFRIASTNIGKIQVIKQILSQHAWEKILIIGEYLDQLKKIQSILGAEMITWEMKPEKRELLFEQFRNQEINILILSRVANFAIDLPDASVLIEVSGLYGSRQEEAQRLGRILRPKHPKNEANFYIVVTENTREVEFVEKRQIFLIEQGYKYDIEIW